MRNTNAFLSQTSGPHGFLWQSGARYLLSLILGVAVLIGLAAGTAFAKPAVTDAKLGVEGVRTRVVLKLTQETEFRVFALGDPHRVVIDLTEVDWQIPAGRSLQGRGLVAAMRYGLFKVGTSRVVLDLSGPAQVSQVTLLPAADGQPLRLLVDLIATADPAFRGQIGRTLFASGETVPAPDAPVPAILVAAPDPVAQPVLTPVSTVPQPVAEPAISAPATGSLDQAATILLPVPKPGGEAKKKAAKPLIVIDPGHGGIDPGAIGNDTMEKTITLAVARAVQKELEATGRFRAILTRDKDVYLPLRDRFRVARENGAELFISLHADSHANSKTRGASVYTLSEKASDSEAAALAAKENKSDVIAGVDLTHESKVVSGILIDLAQRETINLSARFAKLMVNALKKDTLMLGNSHRFAGFAVLKAPDVPSVLLEMGYISSDEDQQLLTSKKHQKKLAKAITQAISGFFEWHEAMRGS